MKPFRAGFRGRALVVSLTSLLLLAGGVWATQAARQPAPIEDGNAARGLSFWRALHVEGSEAFHYRSLAEMTSASDAVVLGTIEQVGQGREVRDLEAEQGGIPREVASTYFAEADIRVDRVLYGSLYPNSGGHVRLDLLLPVIEVLPEIQALVPQSRAVFFLRDMGRYLDTQGIGGSLREQVDGLYQLTSFQGVLRDADGRVAIPEGRTDRFLLELQGQPFDAVLQRLEATPS